MTYKLIRFSFGRRYRTRCVFARGLTLEQAQAHCNDPSTSGDGWFDGYESE